MTIRSKTLIALLLSAIVMLGTMVIITLRGESQLQKKLSGDVDAMIERELVAIVEGIKMMCETQRQTVSNKVNFDLNVAEDILKKKGGVVFSEEKTSWEAINQFSKVKNSIALPTMSIGSKKLHTDASPKAHGVLVDEVQKLVGGTCTIFQRMNKAGDMLRVSTNVLKTDGRRAIGTYIPAINPDGSANAVVETILRGDTFKGRAYVVNAWYTTAYAPLFDKHGEVVGIIYVGVKQESVDALRKGILNTKVGETGYVFVLGGKGFHRGQYIISKNGTSDGKNIWEAKDPKNGRKIVQDIIQESMAKPHEKYKIKYPWKNGDDPKFKEKIAICAYYEPWDWVIGASSYLDELNEVNSNLNRGIHQNFIWQISALIVCFIILIVVLIFALNKAILSPLTKIVNVTHLLSAGECHIDIDHNTDDEMGELVRDFKDMSQKISERVALLQDIASRDIRSEVELSSNKDQLGRALQRMIENLNEDLRNIQHECQQVSHHASSTNDMSGKLKQNMTDTASEIKDITYASEESSMNVKTVASTIAQMARNIKDINQSMNNINASMEEVEKEANGGAETSKKAIHLGTDAQTSMERLQESSQAIGQVTETIKRIADQTNLLALNATIEAASAGEAGKGFAVVANEIKELAGQSSKAAEEIHHTIKTVQENTHTAVSGIHEITGILDQLGQASQTIMASVQNNSIALNEVASNLGQADVGINETSNNVTELEKGTNAISGSISQISQRMEELNDMALSLDKTSEELDTSSQNLNMNVSKYQLKAK